MSETLQKLFAGLAAAKGTMQAVVPGLSASEIGRGLMDVLEVKGKQGAAELAQGLMSGSNSYVPYGEGQRLPESHDQQRDGMSR